MFIQNSLRTQSVNLLKMEEQIQCTQPKVDKKVQFNTPQKITPYVQYQTPTKNKIQVHLETPHKNKKNSFYQNSETCIKGENPESKKFARSINRSMANNISIIPKFQLTRLEQDYIFMSKLGVGNFSKVSLYKTIQNGDLFAIKIAKMSSMFINEVQALGTLNIIANKSRNLIRYFHSWVEQSKIYIVMEYCESNLEIIYTNHRQKKQIIPQSTLKNVLKQTLMGLEFMHSNKMVHLDIKPGNLLFKDKILKISDLGLCRVTRIKKWAELDEGDSRYLAKQVLNYEEGIDLTKADIFSLGMSIYEGITLEELPNNGNNWLKIRNEGLRINTSFRAHYTSCFLDIIESMIRIDWSQRPTASEILHIKYFKDSLDRKNLRDINLIGHNSKKRQSSL